MERILPPYKVFAGSNSHEMATAICQDLGIELGKMSIQYFADGEFEVCFEEPVRGCEVYLVQSTYPNSDNLMELLLMIDAAKRASARSIAAVIPYFGWARQDRKSKPRVSIAAKLVADLLSTAGVDRVITMDLHADQIQGFFDKPVDHLYASSVFLPYIQSLGLEDMCIATPDVGGAKRAGGFSKYLNVPLVLCHKQRAKANVVESMTVIGDVKDKNVVLVDDIIDTGGTLTMAADLLLHNGAKSVRAVCSHPLMSDPATDNIDRCGLVELITTDSIPYNKGSKKVTVLTVAHLIAETIKRIHQNESISSQYLLK